MPKELRIYQDNNGFHIQADEGAVVGWRYSYWKSSWVTLSTVKTLKAARTVREKLEIQQGRVIE